MNTSEETPNPNPLEARQALAAVASTQSTSLRRGIYSRRFAVIVSLWAGALAASLGTGWLLIVLFGGIFAHHRWRQNHTEAWINEVQSVADLWKVVVLSVLVGGLFLGALVGLERFQWGWAPVIAGAIIAVTLYTTMELSYRQFWARVKPSQPTA